jgi:hypothetical protein
MTNDSNHYIIFLRNDREAKESGSCSNLLRRIHGDKISKKVQRLMRDKRKLDKPFEVIIKNAYKDESNDIIYLIKKHTMYT